MHEVKSESEVAQSCLTLSDPWTAAYQAPSSMGFSRQEYWSGVPLPSPTLLLLDSNLKDTPKNIKYTNSFDPVIMFLVIYSMKKKISEKSYTL